MAEAAIIALALLLLCRQTYRWGYEDGRRDERYADGHPRCNIDHDETVSCAEAKSMWF